MYLSLLAGFSTTDFVTVCCCVDPRSPASNLSFWLCVYIYKAQPKLIWLLTCGEDKCRVVDFIVTWVLRLIKRDDGDFGFNGIVFDDDKK